MAASRLKVYATRIGFHDAVVAAPNQKAALAAWDIRENLFQQGRAEIVDDPAAIEAALAHPGVVLRRPAGSDAPFAEDPALPAVPTLARPAGRRKAEEKAAPAAPPAPDRRSLEAAEAALAALEAETRRRMDDIERRRRELEAEAREAEREAVVERRALERARDRARRDYERAGG